jgi:hypothetical protein
VKAYNLHKDIFTTPLKGLLPFGLARMEGIGVL